MSNIVNQADLDERSKAASFIGTLQASYTDFYYLRDMWRKNAEKDALLGISGTGIASGTIDGLNLRQSVIAALEENERVADLIGIKKAARITAIKPSGTSSIVLGTSSGIHAWFAPYYIRRIRVNKNEAIYTYLKDNHEELIEDEFFSPHIQAVISIPIKAPENAVFSDEPSINLLERIKKFNKEWIRPGHWRGDNTNNVSATIYVKEDEGDTVSQWMWENREYYSGLTVLPANSNTYPQMPFEAITKEKYEELLVHLKEIDLTKVIEEEDATNQSGEAACSGDQCTLK